MFWSVGASGYHQDREKQHKPFHNRLHLVNVHPEIRFRPVILRSEATKNPVVKRSAGDSSLRSE